MKTKLLLFTLLLSACSTSKIPIQSYLGVLTESDIYKPYSYKGTVTDVYDGDTFTILYELGYGVTYTDKIRLARVDTPELRRSERERGLMVRDIVKELVLGNSVIAVTDEDKKGKYGRTITEVFYFEQVCKCYLNLSDYLLREGLAREY